MTNPPSLTDPLIAALEKATWSDGRPYTAHENHAYSGSCAICNRDVPALVAKVRELLGPGPEVCA